MSDDKKLDPAYQKFRDSIPVLRKEQTVDIEQQELVDRVNRDIRLYHIAYQEGYARGYQDAVVLINQILAQANHNGDSNENPNT